MPALLALLILLTATPATRPAVPHSAAPSGWDDLLDGVTTKADWPAARLRIRRQFLELIRDDEKPDRPRTLNIRLHEEAPVDGLYTRRLISYEVGEGERAHAYLAIPVASARGVKSGSSAGENVRWPAVIVLHGTTEHGKEQTAGLSGDPTKAYLDDLARRGFVVLAPDHFVAGHRVPPEGPYETRRFYEKHPRWTAVGKFTFEHSIAVDVLAGMPEVDPQRIGVMGHSLGGHGAFFLAAYDERIACAACNCSAGTFRFNPKAIEWARDRWYVYFKHLRPDLLAGRLPPIDMHHVFALVAPRPLLDVFALNDGDGEMQRQRVAMDLSVSRLYQVLERPGDFAFLVHGYGHASPLPSRELLYAWLIAHLQPDPPKPPGKLSP